MASTAKIKIKTGSKALGQFANLPTAFKSPAKNAVTKDTALQKLQNLKATPLRQLQEAASILTQVNRYNINNEKRVEIVRAVLAYVYLPMARYYQTYQSKVLSLPESKERREVILACVDITEQSAIAYKHFFKDIYSARTLGYRRNREKCIETGVRILELLRIQQRFVALRHQKLSVNNWQDVNRVFFSLLVHDDVDEEVTLLGSIGTWTKKSSTVQQVSHATAKKLYISIQLFGLLDAPSWSTRLFHAPDAYLNYVPDAVQIHSDSDAELEPGWLITHIDRKGPPIFQREQHMAEPRVRIEYVNLYNRLVADYESLAKMKFIGQFDIEKLSRPLLDLEAIERFPLLEAMLFGLRPRERKQKRHAAFGHENLKLFFSFRDTFDQLLELANEDVRHLTRGRAFRDKLSGVSSLVTAEDGEYRKTKWEIVNFSTGGILVLTRESAFTNPIQIGQIVAFNPNADVKRPLLGYVSRINRPNDQQVEVAIVRFSNHAESAIVYSDQPKGGTGVEGAGVIIFQSMEGKWCLVAKHDYDFVPGSPLRLLREDNRQLPARLGNVMLTKQEFVVFELSAPGM
ncbi:MAG: hypothetical protein PVG20_09720 [Thioalkalispiraceae bacterium]|jgi:hypothetical protein